MGPIKRLSILMLACICSLLCLPTMAQTKSKGPDKKQAWAQVPGGTVWLEPGRQAYEHDTGLVRDLATGQKSLPITPQSMARPTVAPAMPSYPLYQVPTYAIPSYPAYPVHPIAPPRSPYSGPQYRGPQFVPTYASPNYTPQPWYDLGPGNVYANQPCNGCGAKLGSPGNINARWKTTTLPR